jgi:hypothetical protein
VDPGRPDGLVRARVPFGVRGAVRRGAAGVARADVDHLADGEARHDHRRGAGQHGRGVAPAPARGQVDDGCDARCAWVVAGEAGQHLVEPLAHLGRDRLLVARLREESAHVRLLLGGEVRQRAVVRAAVLVSQRT